MSSVSSALAKQYGVSSKCIRDIWHGRTWPEATFHLWSNEDKKNDDYNGKLEKVLTFHAAGCLKEKIVCGNFAKTET